MPRGVCRTFSHLMCFPLYAACGVFLGVNAVRGGDLVYSAR